MEMVTIERDALRRPPDRTGDGEQPIQAEGLTKRFGTHTAVDALDLEVAHGEVVGFIGENGAGKSTTMRMLVGLAVPSAGTVSIFGSSPQDPAVRARVGYLPGDAAYDPRHTALDVITLVGRVRGTGTGRAAELCERLTLDPSRRIGDLSTGNRRKVGIVAAFMSDPDLLLLDEPTSGLDPVHQSVFDDIVAESVAAGASVLLSSHVLPEVERSADRVAVIRNGRLMRVDRVDELRRNARQRLTLTLGADAAVPDRIVGVAELSRHGRTLELLVEGSLQPTLDALRGVEVQRIVSHDDDLDDLFRSLYQEDPS